MIVRLDATEFCPSSPAVMLSPNARNDVVDSFGGLVTVTRNEQLSVRCRASVAAQVTVFCPIVNGDPATGVQVVLTGACPFDDDRRAEGHRRRAAVHRLRGLRRRTT